MQALRTALSVLLIVIGLAATVFAVPATWMNSHLLDTDEWTAAVGPLIQEQEVQATVTQALVNSADQDGQMPSWGRDLLTAVTAEIVATDTFADVWTDAVRIAHLQLVEAIRDGGTGVDVSDDAIAVDLALLHASLVPRLTEAGVPLLANLPQPEGYIVLENSAETAQVLSWAGKADAWAWPAVGIAAVAMLIGVVIARRPAWAMLGAGLGVTAIALAGLLVWQRQDSLWEDAGTGATGRIAVEALTGSVEGWLTGASVIGAAIALVGLITVIGSRVFRGRAAQPA